VSTEPADRYRWHALGVATLAFASFAAVLVGIPVLAPALRERFHLDVFEVGVMLACAEVGMAVTLMAWGDAADRFGERTTLVAGLTGGGLAIGAAAFAPSTPLFLAGLVITGLCGAAISISSPRLVLGLFGPDERGTPLAIRQSAVPVAGIAVGLTMATIAGWGGTEASLTVLAAAMLAAAVLAAAVLRGGGGREPRTPRETGEHPRRNRRVWRVAAAGGLMLTGQVVLLGFTTVYLVDEQGLTTAAAGVVVAGTLALGALCLLFLGRWSDRRALWLVPMRWVCVATAVGLGLIGVFADDGAWVAIALLALTGALSQSWMTLPTTVLAALVTRQRHGAAMGIQQTLLAFSAGLSPIVFGWGVETFSWGASFAVTGLLMLVPAAMVWNLDEVPRL